MVFGESFVVFGFGYDIEAMLQDVVVTEQLKNSFTLEGERETYLHRIAFQMLANASLTRRNPASSSSTPPNRAGRAPGAPLTCCLPDPGAGQGAGQGRRSKARSGGEHVR